MTKQIQEAIARYLIELGHEAVCENYGHVYEMDVASLSKSGMLHEFEVKISRSDFIADKKKDFKFWHYENAERDTFYCPNYFYYVCPEGLIKPDEVPIYSGLYYYSENKIVMVKNAKRLHKVPANREKVLGKMLRMTVQRKYLGGTMLTWKNKQIAERFNNNLTKLQLT